LRDEIRRLEDIKLAKSGAGQKLDESQSAKIIVAVHAITVEIAGGGNRAQRRQIAFNTPAEFARAAPRLPWPAGVVLYVDHRLPFEHVVNVIDALKQSKQDVTVQIAALAK
jgi:hypothetical protein